MIKTDQIFLLYIVKMSKKNVHVCECVQVYSLNLNITYYTLVFFGSGFSHSHSQVYIYKFSTCTCMCCFVREVLVAHFDHYYTITHVPRTHTLTYIFTYSTTCAVYERPSQVTYALKSNTHAHISCLMLALLGSFKHE